MGMSRCYSLMKCLLIIFNIIFLLVGVGACAFAGWALWDGRASETGAGRAGLCALAAWAAVLTLGALAALAGAIRGSASLLAGAFALLALSALAEGGAAWWGAAHAHQLRQMLRERLRHTLTHDYGVLPARTHMLDAIQTGLQCCGAEGTRDWRHAAWAGLHEDLDLSVGAPAAYYWVPRSCCAVRTAPAGQGPGTIRALTCPSADVGGGGVRARAARGGGLGRRRRTARRGLRGARSGRAGGGGEGSAGGGRGAAGRPRRRAAAGAGAVSARTPRHQVQGVSGPWLRGRSALPFPVHLVSIKCSRPQTVSVLLYLLHSFLVCLSMSRSRGGRYCRVKDFTALDNYHIKLSI